jgi:flagellar protein FliO/FliZ
MLVLADSMMLLASRYSGVWAYIRLILVFIFILALSYYGAKFAGNYQNNVLNSKSNIKVIESYSVGGNKLLAIAKIGEDYYALGIGKEDITFIDKLDASYFDALEESKSSGKSSATGQRMNFKDILSKKRITRNAADGMSGEESDEDDNER